MWMLSHRLQEIIEWLHMRMKMAKVTRFQPNYPNKHLWKTGELEKVPSINDHQSMYSDEGVLLEEWIDLRHLEFNHSVSLFRGMCLSLTLCIDVLYSCCNFNIYYSCTKPTPVPYMAVKLPCVRVQLSHNIWVVQQILEALTQLHICVEPETCNQQTRTCQILFKIWLLSNVLYNNTLTCAFFSNKSLMMSEHEYG